MKVLECTISEELKMVLISRGIADTEDLLDPLYADDLADIKNNESTDLVKELGEFMNFIRYGTSTPESGWV